MSTENGPLIDILERTLANRRPSEASRAGSPRRVIDEPCLCLEPLVAGQPRRWSLQYTFDDPNEGDMGYFVDFCEWEIEEVFAVD